MNFSLALSVSLLFTATAFAERCAYPPAHIDHQSGVYTDGPSLQKGHREVRECLARKGNWIAVADPSGVACVSIPAGTSKQNIASREPLTIYSNLSSSQLLFSKHAHCVQGELQGLAVPEGSDFCMDFNNNSAESGGRTPSAAYLANVHVGEDAVKLCQAETMKKATHENQNHEQKHIKSSSNENKAPRSKAHTTTDESNDNAGAAAAAQN